MFILVYAKNRTDADLCDYQCRLKTRTDAASVKRSVYAKKRRTDTASVRLSVYAKKRVLREKKVLLLSLKKCHKINIK